MSPEKPRARVSQGFETQNSVSLVLKGLRFAAGRPNVTCSFQVPEREGTALLSPQSWRSWKQQVLEWSQSLTELRPYGGTVLGLWVPRACLPPQHGGEPAGFLAGLMSVVQWNPVLCLRNISILTNWKKKNACKSLFSREIFLSALRCCTNNSQIWFVLAACFNPASMSDACRGTLVSADI